MAKRDFKKGEIIIYKTSQNEVELKVRFEKESVWLRQNEIAVLFGKERSVITKHINKIFADKEIDKKSNVQKIHIPNSDRPVEFYSLVVILAVGYRANSSRAIHFRKWATKVLKQYLLQGYVVNKKRLLEAKNKFHEFQEAVLFLQKQSKKELYPAIEDKAAHLLYLTIKDHPFSDGNKRSAAFLFVCFLDKSNYLFKKYGERKINDNALTALALLVAESNPKEKETMIKIIKNLIAE